MTISLYGIPNCDTVKKARTWLEAKGVGYAFHDYKKEGADPANLVFELTETALMKDLAAGMEFSRGLREIGCGLALDDFGTGYGSFTYLKNLPLTSVKIDIEFVRELASHPANRHVVAAIVSLAKAFGLRTIAEGVENEEQVDALAAAGCTRAQGYLFGRPGPAEAFAVAPIATPVAASVAAAQAE